MKSLIHSTNVYWIPTMHLKKTTNDSTSTALTIKCKMTYRNNSVPDTVLFSSYFYCCIWGAHGTPGGKFQQLVGYSAWLPREQLNGNLLNTYYAPGTALGSSPSTSCSHHPQNGELGGSDVRVNNLHQGPKGLHDMASDVSQTHKWTVSPLLLLELRLEKTLPVCQAPF